MSDQVVQLDPLIQWDSDIFLIPFSTIHMAGFGTVRANNLEDPGIITLPSIGLGP
ncbi:hypothetical protein HYC85_021098 [Camellia sinensis]|uniref:Uncharacterized protein n=1 Tax=Camellia sinensis TaxID=4442 RepID=A0A7J7GJ12_CAMSI|nr:hypothetical protein HYC85_021098 [Camellia sinensis]